MASANVSGGAAQARFRHQANGALGEFALKACAEGYLTAKVSEVLLQRLPAVAERPLPRFILSQQAAALRQMCQWSRRVRSQGTSRL